MNTKIKDEVIKLAVSNPNEEVCGFIHFKEGVPFIVPCKNVSRNPGEEFEISAQDHALAMAAGNLLGVYHSHTESSSFSPEDIEYAEELCLPYYLYTIKENTWHEYIPSHYKVDLEGMHFVWGFQDCYGLVRSYYRQEMGIYIKDYDRDENFGTGSNNMILDNFKNENFEIVSNFSDIKNGDSVLFKTTRALPQHLAIFVGNSKMLHHPENALSHIDAFSDRWFSRIFHVLRHKSQFK